MDPITGTIVWGVIWLFAGSVGSIAIYLAFVGIGALISFSTDKEWPIPVAVLLGWISAVAWQIFVLIQVIIHTVNLIQLIMGETP